MWARVLLPSLRKYFLFKTHESICCRYIKILYRRRSTSQNLEETIVGSNPGQGVGEVLGILVCIAMLLLVTKYALLFIIFRLIKNN
jgi:hypothetical protein